MIADQSKMLVNEPLSVQYVLDVSWKVADRFLAPFRPGHSVPGLPVVKDSEQESEPNDDGAILRNWVHVDAFLILREDRTSVVSTVRDMFWWGGLDRQLVAVALTFPEARPHLSAALRDPRTNLALPELRTAELSWGQLDGSVSSSEIRPEAIRLFEVMLGVFSLDELAEASFMLGINFDHLKQGPLKNVMIELIQYCDRHGKFDKLKDYVMVNRSKVADKLR